MFGHGAYNQVPEEVSYKLAFPDDFLGCVDVWTWCIQPGMHITNTSPPNMKFINCQQQTPLSTASVSMDAYNEVNCCVRGMTPLLTVCQELAREALAYQSQLQGATNRVSMPHVDIDGSLTSSWTGCTPAG